MLGILAHQFHGCRFLDLSTKSGEPQLLAAKIKQLDELIGASQSAEEKLLESLPGIGPVFSSVIASEIDGIARFPTSAKFCA